MPPIPAAVNQEPFTLPIHLDDVYAQDHIHCLTNPYGVDFLLHFNSSSTPDCCELSKDVFPLIIADLGV